ncbi:MAG: peptidase T [Proteobacteria bacterium]|nr:peptidase T [Pseudomonadota bacterium]
MLTCCYEALLERFLRYVKLDTQSDPESKTYPSTAKQLDLLRLLKDECEALGLVNVELDKYGYVTATLPSNVDRAVKAVGFIAHVDTSPEVSGANVKPIVHKNYQGEDLVLPDRNDIVIRYVDNPELADQIGNDIVTASGTTLLGADNKSGVAAIMTAMEYLIAHPEIKHGDIRIGFTPDEEIGGGTDYFDIEKFNCYCAYTVDSSTRGMLDTETFSADAMTITFAGLNTHPGNAYHQMINAIKLVSEFVERLPKEGLSPETTRDREGFVHPTDVRAGVDSASIQFILRDFDAAKLTEQKDLLIKLAQETVDAHPGSSFTYEHKEQYRNMSSVLEKFPDVSGNAERAIREAGMEVIKMAVRGGTDGSHLSLNGLPTPNLFAGEQNYHSRYEWVSVQDMLKSAEVIVRIAQIWAE